MMFSQYFTASYFPNGWGAAGDLPEGSISGGTTFRITGTGQLTFTTAGTGEEDLGGALRRYLRGAKRVPTGWRPPELPGMKQRPVPAPAMRADQAEVLPIETMAHDPHALAGGGSLAIAAPVAGGSEVGPVLAGGGCLAEAVLPGGESYLAPVSAHGIHNPEDDEIALLMSYLQEVA